MCSPNRYQISRKVCLFAEQIRFSQGPILCVHRTDTNFPGAPILAIEQKPIFQKRLFSYRTDTNFPGALFFWLPNRYRFSRSSFLATEHIQIFQNPFFLATEQILIFQEQLFSYRTDNDFPGSFFRISTKRWAISRKVPPSEQIFQH